MILWRLNCQSEMVYVFLWCENVAVCLCELARVCMFVCNSSAQSQITVWVCTFRCSWTAKSMTVNIVHTHNLTNDVLLPLKRHTLNELKLQVCSTFKMFCYHKVVRIRDQIHRIVKIPTISNDNLTVNVCFCIDFAVGLFEPARVRIYVCIFSVQNQIHLLQATR